MYRASYLGFGFGEEAITDKRAFVLVLPARKLGPSSYIVTIS